MGQNLVEQLIDIMQLTENHYRDMLPLIQKEKEMVIRARLDNIQAASKEKERLLLSIRQLEHQRQAVLAKLALEMETAPEQLTLSVLSRRVNPEYKDQLMRIRRSLASILSKVGSANNDSRALIHHCIGSIRQALTFMMPKGEPMSVYHATGALSQDALGGRLLSNTV
jgi:flagellar biosynthesis/type III secretory pathway chaperone